MALRGSALRTVQRRSVALMSTGQVELRYTANGAPLSVLKPTSSDVPKASKGQVAVRMLAAPMRSADVRTIKGEIPNGKAGVSTTKGKLRYADIANVQFIPETTAAKLPAIGGNEGVGVVTQVGSGVSGLAEGDRVSVSGTGTWATSIVANAKNVHKVPDGIPLETAATISAPGTALRLLDDFGSDLQAGDVLIQNNAGSSVGQAVIQLAKARGINTINVVNDGLLTTHSYTDQARLLHGLGADVVIPESYLHTSEFDAVLADMQAPKLALDAKGGRQATNMARRLVSGSTMVMYGQDEPFMVPGEKVDGIKFEGFTWASWCAGASAAQFEELCAALVPLLAQGELNTWLERHDFKRYPAACERAENEAYLRDPVLVMDSAAADEALCSWYLNWAGPAGSDGDGRF
eukprot:g2207.t1